MTGDGIEVEICPGCGSTKIVLRSRKRMDLEHRDRHYRCDETGCGLLFDEPDRRPPRYDMPDNVGGLSPAGQLLNAMDPDDLGRPMDELLEKYGLDGSADARRGESA